MKGKVLQELARCVETLRTNEDNVQFDSGRTLERVKRCLNELPHGSGFDTMPTLNFEKSVEGKVVIDGSFHHMNEHGYYDGWTDFAIHITPSLAYGFEIVVRGKFPRKYSDCREYIAETYHANLQESEIEV